jgi:hypothetical protein
VIIFISIIYFYFFQKKSKRPQAQGPFYAIPTLHLEHEHPKGWGSGAVISTIKNLPDHTTCLKIVHSLQTQGCAVIENLYENLCIEKLTYEVNDILRLELQKKSDENSKLQTVIAKPGPFIEAVIYSLSETLMKNLNTAYEEWYSTESNRILETAYTHPPMKFTKFPGFNTQQLRLRFPGIGLDPHVDRASAKLTVLYYLNNQFEGGELVVHILSDEKNKDLSKRQEFAKDGGFSIIKELSQVKIEPKMNRLVVFWSDCVPHEVLDIASNRLSFQVFISAEEIQTPS